MAIGMPGLPGEGGTHHGWEHFCLWFYGNLIRAHLEGCWEAGLKNGNNLDSKRRERNIPQSLEYEFPTEPLSVEDCRV